MKSPSEPHFCHPVAFTWFSQAIHRLDDDAGLLHAAVAISRHKLPDADPQQVADHLDGLADKVRYRLHSNATQAVLAHLHEVLFEQERLRGNQSDYYNARNSYLPAVLESGWGIPITLTLIYKLVAARLNLHVNGLNCPGHFLAEVVAADDRLIIDPFYGGVVLTREEARRRIELGLGERPPDEALFASASHRSWIARMLRNLQNIFSMHENVPDMLAMRELEQLLDAE